MRKYFRMFTLHTFLEQHKIKVVFNIQPNNRLKTALIVVLNLKVDNQLSQIVLSIILMSIKKHKYKKQHLFNNRLVFSYRFNDDYKST